MVADFLKSATRRVAAAMFVAAVGAGGGMASGPQAQSAVFTGGTGSAPVWFGGGAVEAPVVLAQTREERRAARRENRRENRRQNRQERRARGRNGDGDGRRAGRRRGDGDGRRARGQARYSDGRRGGRYVYQDEDGYVHTGRKPRYYGGGRGGYYYHDPYRHYRKERRRERRRDLALGVFGALVGGIATSALANPHRGQGYSQSYSGGGSCDYWADQCARNWGRNNSNFYGCLRYHRCN